MKNPNLARLKTYFATAKTVSLAYLFGSQATGKIHPHSDVDIAVLLSAPTDYFEVRLALMGDLSSLLQRNDVDVAILNQTPLALNYRVIRDGQLLYCRDEDLRIQFVAQTVVRFLDFQPLIQRHEQAILERVGRGELTHGYNPHRGALERYRQLRQRLKGTAPTEL